MRDKSEYSVLERWIIAAFSFVLFGIIGFVLSLALGTIFVPPNWVIALGPLLLIGGLATAGGFLGYHFPGLFNAFLWFMP